MELFLWKKTFWNNYNPKWLCVTCFFSLFLIQYAFDGLRILYQRTHSTFSTDSQSVPERTARLVLKVLRSIGVLEFFILLPSPFGEGLGVRLFYPLISLNFSFGFSEMLRARWNYNEGSLSQRRRLADSMANVRQLVESKGAFQSVHTSPPSVPPRGRSLTPSPSPKGEGSRMTSGAWSVESEEWSVESEAWRVEREAMPRITPKNNWGWLD